jgi:hypothetical protein
MFPIRQGILFVYPPSLPHLAIGHKTPSYTYTAKPGFFWRFDCSSVPAYFASLPLLLMATLLLTGGEQIYDVGRMR